MQNENETLESLSIHDVAKVLDGAFQPQITRILAPLVHSIATDGGKPIRPLFFEGYAGLGKTEMVNRIAGFLENYGVERVDIAAESSIATMIALLVKHCPKGSVESKLFFIDEFHAMKEPLRNFLKRITETGGRAKEFELMMKGNEMKVVIDPTRHFFIGASNEGVGDSALVGPSGRFLPCQFLPYSDEHKGQLFDILKKRYAPEVKLTAESRETALKNCRPFARSLVNLLCALDGENAWIRETPGAPSLASKEGIKKALARREYFPGGWTRAHIAILRFLCKKEATHGRQVQEIAMEPLEGADRETVRQLLDELTQGGFVRTMGNGRKTGTGAAVEYLESLAGKVKTADKPKAKPAPAVPEIVREAIPMNASH